MFGIPRLRGPAFARKHQGAGRGVQVAVVTGALTASAALPALVYPAALTAVPAYLVPGVALALLGFALR